MADNKEGIVELSFFAAGRAAGGETIEEVKRVRGADLPFAPKWSR